MPQKLIEKVWENRELLKDLAVQNTINQVIEELDKGKLRVAEPLSNGQWQVNEWVKKAVILYFPIRKMETIEIGPLEFHDKMQLKKNYAQLGVRVVPHAIARYGAYLASGVIMMPSYVNIGAYVDSGTMVDTWATVGSCAQIGKNVHLSGGVGIGGVLEPPNAVPVVVEDECMIGSRSIVAEGARGPTGAGLGAGPNITKSTHVIDVETGEELPRGEVPAWSVAVNGTRFRKFPGGKFGLPAVLILKPLPA